MKYRFLLVGRRLLLLLLLLFAFGSIGKIFEDIILVGIGVASKEVLRATFEFVFSECGDFHLIGVFPGFLLVAILGLF